MRSNCKVTFYVKTYRHFFTRAAEQMGISDLTGKRLKCVKQSAQSDHQLDCNCLTDVGHFDILASDTNKLKGDKRCIVVELHQFLNIYY